MALLPDHPQLVTVLVLSAMSLGYLPTQAGAEPVIGQFELKTLDSEPGAFEFQSQNAWSWGQPSRDFVDDPSGIEFDENAVIRARYALELEMGFTHFFKMRVGVEFEQERFDDPATIEQANDFDSLRLADVGVEFVAILVPRDGDGAGLGVVAEIEGPVDHSESNNLTLGPIFEFQAGRWLFATVPMFVYGFGGDTDAGDRVDTKWDFAYAAQLMYRFSNRWSLALEGYGTVERLEHSGHPSEPARTFGDFDQHRAGAIVYYTYDFGADRAVEPSTPGSALLSESGEKEGKSMTVGFGLLEGLNGNTPDHTLKLSIEVHF